MNGSSSDDKRVYMPWLYPLLEHWILVLCLVLIFVSLAGAPAWIIVLSLLVLPAGGALVVAYMSDYTSYVLYGDRLVIDRPFKPCTVMFSDVSGVWLCPALINMRAQYADAWNLIKIVTKDGKEIRLFMRHPDEMYREIRARCGMSERPRPPNDRIA